MSVVVVAQTAYVGTVLQPGAPTVVHAAFARLAALAIFTVTAATTRIAIATIAAPVAFRAVTAVITELAILGPAAPSAFCVSVLVCVSEEAHL